MTDDTPPVDRDFILPGNATPLERAIADTDGRLDDIDTDLVRRVKAIDEAPVAYLPQLAYERSVDVWDPRWSEDVQREVDRVAPRVHRQKGSPFAIKAALAALQVDAVVTQWWETIPRGVPYTFEVQAFARARLYDGPLLDARLIRVVFASILRSKPATRAFALSIGGLFTDRLGLANVAIGRTRAAAAVQPASVLACDRSLGLANVVMGCVHLGAAVIPILPPEAA